MWPIWQTLLSLLARLGLVSLDLVKLDGSLVPSFEFTSGTGYSGKHKQTGTKVSAAVDTAGIPLAVKLARGNIHDLDLAAGTIGRIRVGNKTRPGTVLADKGYDSVSFRRELRRRGIKANIPERRYTHRRKIGRPPKYDAELGKQRFVVERTNAWLKSFRRLHFRFDRTLPMFKAFVQLACIVICVRNLVA